MVKGDVLHIIDVETRKSQKIEMEMDGVFSAAWSPKGNEIAFVGHVGSSSDIYIYDVNKHITRKITDDIFTDSYPSWNPLGTEIVFVSDRGEHVNGEFNGKMVDHNYSQTDIYTVNVKNPTPFGRIRRIHFFIRQIIMVFGTFLFIRSKMNLIQNLEKNRKKLNPML